MKQRIDTGSPEEKRHRLAVNILNGTIRIPRTAGYGVRAAEALSYFYAGGFTEKN